MNEPFLVFVVDDDPYILIIIQGILEHYCQVETFESVEVCQGRLSAVKPDMFLLDVKMPDVNGLVFCRQIKDDFALKHIPVTFVSSQESLEARLKGYEAGGEDFIVKPFQPEELLRKCQAAQQIVKERFALARQLDDSEMLSSLVMANMDEYAILVRFIRELISYETSQDIADGLLEMLKRFRLDGVVQTRVLQQVLTVSARGANLPLETSVLEHVRGMGRIFEFRNRSVHNFNRLTMLISNMPVHDAEFCGRLRDHLCIAAECADSRLNAIEIQEINRHNQAGILDAIDRLAASSNHVRGAYLRDRASCAELLMMLEQNLSRVLAHVELSNGDENSLTHLITNFSEDLLEVLDGGEEICKAMEDLVKRLGQLNRGQ
ncbi:MAG: response regulator [Rhodocyclaceae bacterium]|nr:response regulator [Rhodocyclaceae bacterium]